MSVHPTFACDGGPHLLLPVALGPAWRGTPESGDILDPSSDYGRACAVSDAIAVIRVGTGQAVVLGGSPPLSSWTLATDPLSFVVFVLTDWVVDDLSELLGPATSELSAARFLETGLLWDVPAGGAALLFAGDQLAAPVYEPLHLAIAPGHYRISAAHYESHLGSLETFRFLNGGT